MGLIGLNFSRSPGLWSTSWKANSYHLPPAFGRPAGKRILITPELEGNWVREKGINSADSFMFKGNQFGTNGNILNSYFGYTKKKFEYFVDQSEEPFKIYLIIQYFNRDVKVPFGIYRINGNDLSFCYAEEKQKILYDKPVGPLEYKFPKSFNGYCMVLKKSN